MKRDASRVVPRELAESIPTIGLRMEGRNVWVALPDDFSAEEIKSAIVTIKDSLLSPIKHELVPRRLILEQIAIVFDPVDTQALLAPGNFELRNEKTVVDTVNTLIATSIKSRASDIHIEPQDDGLYIRIRVDGRLENLVIMDNSYGPAIISRLKVLAKMSIVERRRPQDGQFNFEVGGRNIDLRLSTIATLYGEKIEIRILDTTRNIGGLVSLGMPKTYLKNLTNMLYAGQGLIIAAGPTGSGKSTTMHSALQIVNSPELNVSTIEDPVEYVIPGINHVPINEAAGLTFATQLRALLRQDPDVVLVGEIRDSETARIAVQAALAGRLVLTTLHAQNAVGAIYRLFQMGIEPYQVAASLVGVISQRLVRRNCEFCSVEDEVSKVTAKYIKDVTKTKSMKLLKGLGCTICRNTGFFDRVGAFQLFEINEPIRELISQRPSPSQLEQLSRKHGLRSLKEETILLATKGLTSISEVMKVADDVENDEIEETIEISEETISVEVESVQSEAVSEVVSTSENVNAEKIEKTPEIPTSGESSTKPTSKPIRKTSVINNSTTEISKTEVQKIQQLPEIVEKPKRTFGRSKKTDTTKVGH